MTCQELLSALQTLPREAQVFVKSAQGELSAVLKVAEHKDGVVEIKTTATLATEKKG